MKSYGLGHDTGYNLTEADKVLLQEFFKHEKMSAQQAEQFAFYLQELQIWNEKFNITTLTSVKDIILYHFQDSIKIREFVDVTTKQGVVDVGSGGGFPGIPLKIFFPETMVVLIEVNNKKIQFMEHIINSLQLPKIEVYPHDWRTFLRKTDYNVDLFCARASLEPKELLRMFKPSCIYNKAELVYWASHLWAPDSQEIPFIRREEPYTIGDKKRKFVFFGKT